MNSQPDNSENLRRLLILKRHEQPPPGYFDHLATQVMRRLEAGEVARAMDVYERLALEAPWLLRMWERLVARPVALGGVGAALCSALLVGFFYLHGLDVPTSRPNDERVKLSGTAPPPSLVFNQPSVTPAFVSSTNPISGAATPRSLFDGLSVETQPVQWFLQPSR